MLAALLIHRIPHDPRPAHREPLPGARLLHEARSGIDTVRAEPRLRLLVVFLAATTFIEGAIDVLVVVAALELLDMGASGVGWLNAAWGVGGLLGGAAALAVLRRGRIARGLAGGCVLAGVALGLIATWPRPGVAMALLVVLGVGYAWVEVAGLTLMQRLVSDEVLARVFGVVESTYVASTGLGAVLAPVAVALFGIEGALVAVGALLPLLAVVSWTRLARFEATTPIPERQFALLRSCSLFAPLPLATVENLAARLVPVAVTKGQRVIRQGDTGDRFYVIAQGHVGGRVRRRAAAHRGPGRLLRRDRAAARHAAHRDRPRDRARVALRARSRALRRRHHRQPAQRDGRRRDHRDPPRRGRLRAGGGLTCSSPATPSPARAGPSSRSSTTAPSASRLRRTLPAGTGRTAPHRHLEDAVERFTLLEGEATGTVAGEKRRLRAGDVMEIPRGASHVHPHTGRGMTAVVEHVVEPRVRFVEVYFPSWLAWLADGRVDRQDEPKLAGVMAVIDAARRRHLGRRAADRGCSASPGASARGSPRGAGCARSPTAG